MLATDSLAITLLTKLSAHHNCSCQQVPFKGTKQQSVALNFFANAVEWDGCLIGQTQLSVRIVSFPHGRLNEVADSSFGNVSIHRVPAFLEPVSFAA